MLTQIKLAALVVATVVLMGLTASASSGAPGHQREAMNWHAQSGTGPVGETAVAQLVRRDNGVSFQIRAQELKPGHAYTVWIVIVNNPDECTTSPCTPVDIIGRPDVVGTQILWGGGGIAGASGRLGFGGSVGEGDIDNGWYVGGLDDAMTAEIHFVLNDHGPVIPSFMPEMIKTYRAGCTDASLPVIFPATAFADGTPGPNTCRLYQTVDFQ
jgi:hypothetical protein